MTTPIISTKRQRELLDQLAQVVAERAYAEVQIDTSYSSREIAAKTQFEADRKKLTDKYEEDKQKLQSEFQDAQSSAHRKYEKAKHDFGFAQAQFSEQSAEEFAFELETAKRDRQVARQRAKSDFDAEQYAPQTKHAELEAECDARWQEMLEVEQQVHKILRRRGADLNADLPPAPPQSPESASLPPMERFETALEQARQTIRGLEHPPASKMVKIGWLIGIFIAATAAAVYPIFRLIQNIDVLPEGLGVVWLLGGSAIVGIFVTVLFRQIVMPLALKQTLRVYPVFAGAKQEARTALDTALATSKSNSERAFKGLVERRDRIIAEADATWERLQTELADDHKRRLAKSETDFHNRKEEIERSCERETKAVEEKYPPLLAQLDEEFETASLRLREKYETRLASSRNVQEQKWAELVEQWSAGYGRFKAALDEMNEFCDRRFPEWGTIDWKKWQPASDVVSSLRFGRFTFRLDMLEGGVPRDKRLATDQMEFAIPAVLSYPECPSLLFEAYGDGRDQANQSIQNVMLRLIASMPPGKVRFTIIDPVGLGQNFSAFMHLADYDEKLVASRIWTEQSHINKRLTDLTEHMENVIQKYLRNEFESIQKYNEHAGEVAEPFQILVVANFPANFSDEATRRLISIANSGARCGVYTLISVDTRMKLPRNFELADLEKAAATLQYGGNGFAWKDSELARYPLELDDPPEDDQFTDAVRVIGELAKDANRVEVPFSMVCAEDGHWWEGDTRSEIEVALGRAGATKLQAMRLGKGTSQHVLVSGKTGSGKSTMMHALITNLAIHYSPNEMQFYLIDFKKGVEFKPYATLELPHARVIAIESEREFGLSVLERLDVELKRRGDTFRQEGVQDVKGYRDAHPDAVMPRILLIIDEFQELFVQDDKIAADASLLLDRLVRQGRAFGIHVLLGSQTLSGAYSLPRSTIGQMAVRIALQCSEGDAHLILSEDNTAARLLNRPGEAIYNDANGLLEGNHPFQVVWLPDHEREGYLRQLTEMKDQRRIKTEAAIVFEGNVPADPSRNELLRDALAGPSPSTPTMPPRAWLGAAVAIKDPTVATMRRQSGANLLMVGQEERMAIGVLANSVISLASTLPCNNGDGKNNSARFLLLDGTRADSPEAGFWPRFAKRLPIGMSIIDARDLAATIANVATELDRRIEAGDDGAEPIFLIVYNLSRFRDLRKSDEYGFSSFGDDDEKPQPDKQFATILREGPSFGIQTLIWCDTYTNAGRSIDRQSIRDLEMRVLFQMSATDSSNLMDSPVASRLGTNRAILFSEELGQFEKFRPYGPPTDEWLDWVRQQLESRSVNAPTA